MAAFHLAMLFSTLSPQFFSRFEPGNVLFSSSVLRRVCRHFWQAEARCLRSLSIKTPSNLHISAAVTAVNAGRDAGLIVRGLGERQLFR